MTSACSNGALTIRLRAPNQAANQQRTASKKATANRRQILFLAEHETIPITSTKPSANSSDDKTESEVQPGGLLPTDPLVLIV